MKKAFPLYWHFCDNKNGYEIYELKREHVTLVTLSINTFLHTAKVDCINDRRIFHIEKEGFLRNKTCIRNEYGIEIGELHTPAWFSNEGFIELNGEKFHYQLQDELLNEVIIYKESKQKPLLICGLHIDKNNAATYFDKHHEVDINSALLMALCWFLFMPVAKENMAQLVS